MSDGRIMIFAGGVPLESADQVVGAAGGECGGSGASEGGQVQPRPAAWRSCCAHGSEGFGSRVRIARVYAAICSAGRNAERAAYLIVLMTIGGDIMLAAVLVLAFLSRFNLKVGSADVVRVTRLEGYHDCSVEAWLHPARASG